jgi:hypothetical protein
VDRGLNSLLNSIDSVVRTQLSHLPPVLPSLSRAAGHSVGAAWSPDNVRSVTSPSWPRLPPARTWLLTAWLRERWAPERSKVRAAPAAGYSPDGRGFSREPVREAVGRVGHRPVGITLIKRKCFGCGRKAYFWWIKISDVGGKRIFGGLKAYLRATDHTSSNIISRVSGVGGKHIFGGLKFRMWEESVFLVD